MLLHVVFVVVDVVVINNFMFAIKELIPLYFCFYGYRTMQRFVLYFYCVMLMAMGVLGIFSILSLGSYSFLSILLYIGELALFVLIGYRLFSLIGEFGDGLATAGKTSKDIEKKGAKG